MQYFSKNSILVIAKLLSIVFVAEAIVMSVLPIILPRSASPVIEALVDSCLLTLISGPLLWLVIVGPLHAAAQAEQLKIAAQVATGVAHELRNPLTAIKMLVQSHRESRQVDDHLNQDLQIIEDEVRRMERSIQTFLDFGRPRRPERRSIDLRELVSRTFSLVEPLALRKQIELRYQNSPTPITVNADWEQIQQLLLNLTVNAIDAAPTKGAVEVDAQMLSDGSVRVSVIDNGPGISAKVKSRLFEPFVTDKEAGVGLGLVISRRIAEEHGGQLVGENRNDGGARFVLELPPTADSGGISRTHSRVHKVD